MTRRYACNTEQLENQRQLAIAGLDKCADNEARIDAINAQAARQRQKLEYDDAARMLADYLDRKKQAIELDRANGVTKEAEYQRQLTALDRAGLDAQLQLAGDYEQDNSAIIKKGTDFEIAQRKRATEEKKRQEEVKQGIRDTAFQAADQFTRLIIDNFGKESAAGQAALITKKTLAIAEIAINLEKQLSLNAVTGTEIGASLPPPAGPIIGTAYTIASNALAIVAAATATANILKLQRGGVAVGPGHEAGGIALYRQGRPAGIEIEGGEVVLTRGVWSNPGLRPVADWLNQAGGGTPLLPRPHLALGGIARPLVMQQLRGGVGEGLDYNRLAQAMSQLQVKATISDVKAGLERDSYTQQQANS